MCAQEAGAEGLLAAAALVLRAGGPRAFLRGVRARVLYQMPAAAICWLTYESLKHALTTVRRTRLYYSLLSRHTIFHYT